MTHRRGDPNAYKPTHAHIAPSLGVWRGLCGRCNAELHAGRSKKHPIYGLICKEGCKK